MAKLIMRRLLLIALIAVAAAATASAGAVDEIQVHEDYVEQRELGRRGHKNGTDNAPPGVSSPLIEALRGNRHKHQGRANTKHPRKPGHEKNKENVKRRKRKPGDKKPGYKRPGQKPGYNKLIKRPDNRGNNKKPGHPRRNKKPKNKNKPGNKKKRLGSP